MVVVAAPAIHEGDVLLPHLDGERSRGVPCAVPGPDETRSTLAPGVRRNAMSQFRFPNESDEYRARRDELLLVSVTPCMGEAGVVARKV